MGHSSLEGQYSHSSSLVDNVRFSQQAPIILGAKVPSAKINLLPAQQEDPGHYVLLEQLFLSCLQTGDDKSALQCLELLSDRFGTSNERTSGLYGIYEEAVAKGQNGLEKCLQKYDSILSENPVNLVRVKLLIDVQGLTFFGSQFSSVGLRFCVQCRSPWRRSPVWWRS